MTPPDNTHLTTLVMDLAAELQAMKEAFDDKRHDVTDLRDELQTMQQRMDRRVNSVEANLQANTDMTAKIALGTGQVILIFESMKSGVKVLGWIGIAAKWVGGIVGAIAAIYAFIQTLKGS
jgi:uncharacterized protein YoxC